MTTGSAGSSATGAAGTSAKGAAGDVGATGAGGDSGGAGTSVMGAAGDSGAAGDAGGAGTTGAAGTTAAAGTTGAAGTTAAAGTNGAAGTSGAAGTGAAGTAPPPACNSVAGACQRSCWTLTPSLLCDNASCGGIMANQKEPRYALDGNQVTRYTTGRKQGGGFVIVPDGGVDGGTDGGVVDAGLTPPPPPEYVVLSFPRALSITGFEMTSAGTDGPAIYKAQYSIDGTTFQAFNPPVGGVGSNDVNVTFAPTIMKALRIDQLGIKDKWWSIHELTAKGCIAQ